MIIRGCLELTKIFVAFIFQENDDERLMEKRISLSFWHQLATTKFE